MTVNDLISIAGLVSLYAVLIASFEVLALAVLVAPFSFRRHDCIARFKSPNGWGGHHWMPIILIARGADERIPYYECKDAVQWRRT